jgi:hypothetical protein
VPVEVAVPREIAAQGFGYLDVEGFVHVRKIGY